MSRAAPTAAVSESVASSALPSHCNPGAARSGRRQRAQRRVAHRVPCRVRIEGRIPSTLVGQTVNLSVGGLSIQLSCDLPIGARVEVLVPAPHNALLQVTGCVVHARRVMTGGFELGIMRDRVAPSEPAAVGAVGFRPVAVIPTVRDPGGAV